MRRPVRSFTVEHKRGARQVTGIDTPLLETPAPTPMPEPPRQWAPEPTRWAAAEALFSIPPADAPEPAIADEPTILRRILPSLNEPAAPAYEYEEAPKRRGRKPGSRNKTSRAMRQEHGPKTVNSSIRSAFEIWARDEEAEDVRVVSAQTLPEASALESYAVESHAAEPCAVESHAIAADAPPLSLNRRGRLVRADLPRALRWQARLPRFAR